MLNSRSRLWWTPNAVAMRLLLRDIIGETLVPDQPSYVQRVRSASRECDHDRWNRFFRVRWVTGASRKMGVTGGRLPTSSRMGRGHGVDVPMGFGAAATSGELPMSRPFCCRI